MRVAVVGAGLAGLTAATQIARAGVEVVVLEARDRVGGRMHGIQVGPGRWADAGAAYLGDRHTELHALLSEHGLKTVATAMEGDSRFAFGSDKHSREGRFPPLNAVALGEMFELLDELARSIVVEAPWLTPKAGLWDKTTARQWAEENLTHHDSKLFFPLFLGEMMAAAPEQVSVLHMAFYLRSGGGIRYLNAFEGGAQQDRIAGGAHRLCELLAEQLGDRVRLEDPVRAIHQDADGVTVRSEAGDVRSDAAVVALPPALGNELEFVPALPAPRYSKRTAPGCAVKVQLVYPRPLWRDHGLSGWSVSAGGPLLSTVDDSPADLSVGVLTGFVTGSGATDFSSLSAREQRAAAIAHVDELFPMLPEPTAVHVTDWISQKRSRGCYAALFGPGDWMAHGPHLTTPHHHVHWAGTETSTEFFGLMEGAVRSGMRAASEVLNNYSQGEPDA